MIGMTEAIARVPPAPSSSVEVNAAQLTPFGAGAATAAVAIPGTFGTSAVPAGAGGCWITFLWIPTVANEVVRLCFGNSSISAANANDRVFVAGVDHDYWCPLGYTHWRGVSAGGGNLSWHRSSR